MLVEISRVPLWTASLCVGLRCMGCRLPRVWLTHPPWFCYMHDGPRRHGSVSPNSSNERLTGPAFKLHSWSLRVIFSYTWALLYIQKSYDFIKVGNVQFVPTYGRPPEFSEDLHETLVALLQTIYWTNYLFLACGGPEPRATAGLEKEFREELPVGGVASILLLVKLIFSDSKRIRFSEICPLTMWTHGILLVRDAIVLLGILPTDGECSVRTLGCYSRNLTLPAQARNIGSGDGHAIRFWHRWRNSLRNCSIT